MQMKIFKAFVIISHCIIYVKGSFGSIIK